MKRINSLNDLLMMELSYLLNAENQLAEALPKMAEASQSSALKAALEGHLEVTKDHVKRLHDIFSNIAQNPQEEICNTMKGFISESEDIINKAEKSPARDAALISVAQKVEEYEIIKYKTVREHAADLGHTRIVELFTITLGEERAMIFHLNELAQYMINAQAINPFDSRPQPGGFYIPEGKFRRGGGKKKPKNTDVSRFINEGNPNIQDSPEKEKD